MASVVGFTKIGGEFGKYDIKLCNMEPHVCDIQSNYYRLKNENPHSQYFPFPSTMDNINVFIPSRIIEDRAAFKKYVIDLFRKQPKCLKIDPCNVYTKDICCDGSWNPNDVNGYHKNDDGKEKDKNSNNGITDVDIIWIVVISILLVLLIAGVISMVVHVSKV